MNCPTFLNVGHAQMKLEMEAQQTTDELDVLRDKARQLAQAESAIAKYKTKMEEVVALKKQVQPCSIFLSI